MTNFGVGDYADLHNARPARRNAVWVPCSLNSLNDLSKRLAA
jgi:hypothetical protein